MMFLNEQFNTMTVTQMYEYDNTTQFYLVMNDESLVPLNKYVPRLSDTPVDVDVRDVIAVVVNGTIPGSGYAIFFTYSLS